VVALIDQHQINGRCRQRPDRGQTAKTRANDDHDGTSVFHEALLSVDLNVSLGGLNVPLVLSKV